MFTFFGDCDKHDFVIALSMSIKALSDKEVTIVTDHDKHYKYFEGEVSGVKIGKSRATYSDVIIYDCHNTILSDIEETKLIGVTDFSRNSIDQIRGLQRNTSLNGLLVIEEDSYVPSKYVDTYLGTDYKVYTYPYSPRRKFDSVFEGTFKFKGLDQEFLSCLGSFLADYVGVSSKDLKSLWNYLRRRG